MTVHSRWKQDVMSRYATIDQALGDAGDRYFGEGHRRTAYEFEPVEVSRGHASGRGRVSQAGAWSTKGATTLAPHLSSIDAVVLTALALEQALALEPVPVEALVVTDVTVRARSAADPSGAAIAVQAGAGWDPQHGAFVGSGSVGPIRVDCVLTASGSVPRQRDVAERRPFFAHHLGSREQHIDDLEVDRDARSLRARVGALEVRDASAGPFTGLQASRAGQLSVAECIVCLAQLAQVMAYEHDQVARAESSTFWMRRLNVSLSPPYPSVGQLLSVEAMLTRALSVRLDGQEWRSLRLTAEAPGLRAEADVAHVVHQRAEV
jgi:hypothetical protein